jgi:hypothetical protein
MEHVWQPIATAPADIELKLSIYDKGEYHAPAFPCRRESLGWRDVRTNRPMPLEPDPLAALGSQVSARDQVWSRPLNHSESGKTDGVALYLMSVMVRAHGRQTRAV